MFKIINGVLTFDGDAAQLQALTGQGEAETIALLGLPSRLQGIDSPTLAESWEAARGWIDSYVAGETFPPEAATILLGYLVGRPVVQDTEGNVTDAGQVSILDQLCWLAMHPAIVTIAERLGTPADEIEGRLVTALDNGTYKDLVEAYTATQAINQNREQASEAYALLDLLVGAEVPGPTIVNVDPEALQEALSENQQPTEEGTPSEQLAESEAESEAEPEPEVEPTTPAEPQAEPEAEPTPQPETEPAQALAIEPVNPTAPAAIQLVPTGQIVQFLQDQAGRDEQALKGLHKIMQGATEAVGAIVENKTATQELLRSVAALPAEVEEK